MTAQPADLTERLARCYTGAVHDVLRAMGHRDIVLPPEIKAIAPRQTAEGGPGAISLRESGTRRGQGRRVPKARAAPATSSPAMIAATMNQWPIS